MIIGFTCKVCNHRQHKYMSKKAYTKGVVLIRCDGCKNLHLIADNLGWYDSQKPPGTIEQILEKKGQKVHRARVATPTAQLPDDPAEIAKMHEADLLNEDNGMLEFLAKEQAQDGQRTAEVKGAEKESKP
ncbi:hypothetical protein HDU85_007160 [Gaertneriomyces sp. JEL0708]|nr:hypothetical protein HDU85_007160 [Gaertneriomyces sp. JEL0708]